MTPQWTVDDSGVHEYGPILESPGGYFVSKADLAGDGLTEGDWAALVADVRAARLVDDMAAVIRRLDGGWHVLYRHDGDLAWQKGSHIQEPMSPGEVAALHHARQQEGP